MVVDIPCNINVKYLMDRKIQHLFIINPKSFWHRWKEKQMIEKIHSFFSSIGDNNYEIYISRFPRDASGFIPMYVKNLGDDTTLRVYSVGGDGIFFDCLNGVMGLENIELGIMPYGYTNNFINSFGKNSNAVFRNIENQYKAQAVPLDVIRCGSNYTVNYCVTGIEAEAIRYAEEIRKNRDRFLYKWLSMLFYKTYYLLGAFLASFNKKKFHRLYNIEIDNEKLTGSFLGAGVLNSSYNGGIKGLVSKAMPNDGILDIIAISGQGHKRTFTALPFFMFNLLFKDNLKIIYKRGKKIKIRSDKTILYIMENIPFFDRELEIELLAGALQFIDAGNNEYKGISNG